MNSRRAVIAHRLLSVLSARGAVAADHKQWSLALALADAALAEVAVPAVHHGDIPAEIPPSQAELDYIAGLGYDRDTFRAPDGTFDATSTDLLRRRLAWLLSGPSTGVTGA